jgi:nitrile hydratase
MSAPRFPVGAVVRVLDLAIEGHIRVPAYVRGKAGVIERYCGPYLNPEDLAFGRATGPAAHLYQVEFLQKDLWENYAGNQADRLFIEIYEHWLDASE